MRIPLLTFTALNVLLRSGQSFLHPTRSFWSKVTQIMGNSNATPILNSAGEPATSIFQFNVPAIDGGEVSLSTFRGKKAYLVVNVASK